MSLTAESSSLASGTGEKAMFCSRKVRFFPRNSVFPPPLLNDGLDIGGVFLK